MTSKSSSTTIEKFLPSLDVNNRPFLFNIFSMKTKNHLLLYIKRNIIL